MTTSVKPVHFPQVEIFPFWMMLKPTSARGASYPGNVSAFDFTTNANFSGTIPRTRLLAPLFCGETKTDFSPQKHPLPRSPVPAAAVAPALLVAYSTTSPHSPCPVHHPNMQGCPHGPHIQDLPPPVPIPSLCNPFPCCVGTSLGQG